MKPKQRDYTVIVDTREQKPYEFDGLQSMRGYLKTGDYSVLGCELSIGIERKSWADFYACLASSRRRFEDCLERLSAIPYSAVIIEGDLATFDSAMKRDLNRALDCGGPCHSHIQKAQARLTEQERRCIHKPFLRPAPGGRYVRSKIPTTVATQSVIAWMWRYRVPIYLAGDRAGGERWCLLMLDDAYRQVKRDERNQRKAQ